MTQLRVTATERIKTVPCSECDEPIEVGSNTHTPKRHVECGVKKMADHNRKMALEGTQAFEHWHEHWVRGMREWLLATGLPPSE